MFIIQLNVTAITLIPVALIISLVFSVFIISDRESLNQINNSLSNILNIDKLEM